MRRALLTVLGMVLVLAVWTATATAAPAQSAGQSATSEQGAGALTGSAQVAPSNAAAAIRVLSPGDAGDVSQSNDASASSGAVNLNGTGQDVDQSQGGSGTQVAGQANDSDQSAAAGALAAQEDPSNTDVGIRVLSPGDDGDVDQSNSADAGALAANGNLTGQDADQTQGGAPAATSAPAPCGCEPAGGTQVAGQSNDSDQSAHAGAAAIQEHPSNTAVGIRVLSPGDDGDVSQSNSADAGALAANGNVTGQDVDQSQGGSGTQVAGQANDSDQSAHAGAAAVQEKPSNTAVGIRVLSPGDAGDVSQSNSADAGALAANGNLTHQDVDQTQSGAPCGCGSHGGGTQVAGQANDSDQSAAAGAIAAQKRPSNTAVGIRVLSPGDDGDVDQSNDATAKAGAVNLNGTGQSIDQSQGGSGGTQVAGQKNTSDQSAHAGAVAVQEKPSNTAVGIRVLSPGDGGDVDQSNSADAGALAANGNLTHQDIDQTQGGGAPCGCGYGGTQVAGQSNGNWQAAGAVAVAAQDRPSNEAVGIRVLSPGDDGDVSQSNSADAGALAANGNVTHQDIDQTQGGGYPCGCGAGGTQVAGQASSSGQHAFGFGLAAQERPSNSASATKVGHHVGCGCDSRLSKVAPSSGDVTQSNTVGARAGALNFNGTGQSLDQTGGGTQVAGQLNRSYQGAGAIAAALQFGASNRAT